jgi:hypothetical protein
LIVNGCVDVLSKFTATKVPLNPAPMIAIIGAITGELDLLKVL